MAIHRYYIKTMKFRIILEELFKFESKLKLNYLMNRDREELKQ